MLHPDRRKAEREAQRDEFKIIACLSIALVLAVVLFGAGLTASLLWRRRHSPCNGSDTHVKPPWLAALC